VTGPCTLGTPTAEDTTVSCSAPGTYTATLTANDGNNPTVSDSTTVTISETPTNEPPSVDAGPGATGVVGAVLNLNGAASDPDGDPLTLGWTITGPCTLGTPTAEDTTVSCSTPGTYTATLTADDGNNPPVSDTTKVTISEPGEDTTPPRCSVIRGSWPNVLVRFRDKETGIASITMSSVENATVAIPSFTPGSTEVVVEATQVVPNERSIIELTAVDAAGNTRVCRAVIVEGFVCRQIFHRFRHQFFGSHWHLGIYTTGCYPIPDAV
jgi:hypothetical protein